MRCLDCQRVVEAYFDGELDEQTTLQVAEHLGACAPCQSLFGRLEEEQELYLSYGYDAEPAPDFWNNILARTAAENAARPTRPFSRLGNWFGDALGRVNALRLSPSLAALLVLVAIGITVAVMRYGNSREDGTLPVNLAQNEGVSAPTPRPDAVVKSSPQPQGQQASSQGSEPLVNAPPQPPPPQQVAKVRAGRKDRNQALSVGNERNARIDLRPDVAGRPQTSDELVREAEQKYVAAIAMLSRDVNRRRSQLDPGTAARFEQTLAAVDRTIADTRRAARKHPGDPVAAQYMLTAYAKKVEVLREIIGY